jgi:hypothetical protein
MAIKARDVCQENPFDAARAQFFELLDELQSPEKRGMDHSQAEEHVVAGGRKVMRLLLQGYLDLRSYNDAGPSVVGSDGVERTHRRMGSVPLKSLVGEVTVTRERYSARGRASVAPLDGALNLPSGQYSAGVQKGICEEVARGSYDEAVNALERHHGLNIGKRQAEEVAAAAAQDFDAFYEARSGVTAKSGPTDINVLSTDGKGIVMLPDSLREATRKAAAKAEPKLTKRLSKGEKRGRKRMALVAAVYSIAPFIRKPEDVLRDLRPVQDTADPRPRPQDKRVWASIEKTAQGVMDQVFQEALKRDPDRKKSWVGLVDGNATQLGDLLACADHYGVDVTVIVDIIHVIEYLWDAAWAFHQEGDRQAEQWVSERLLEVLRGRCVHVAAGIRRTATNRNLDAKTRKPADEAANYLLTYKEFLRYDEYLAAGYPIATGVIEGACRYLVKDRMDITGARWSVHGAEAVLRLRALRTSGDFDAYWTFHQAQELSRNHLSRYAGGQLPQIRQIGQKEATGRHLRVVK